jgi:DNA-binding transcriptional LysR family regulator
MKTHNLDDDQLPHLGTFSKAAEFSSFTGAAKTLGLSQAAVSQRIQVLEKVLDVSLFRRQGGRVFLTEAGQRLYDYAEKILSLHQKARQNIAGQKKPPISGNLALGASTVPGEHLVPALLSTFHERFPRIQVKVEISDSMKVVAQVERGQISLGLVGIKTDSPHLEFRRFATDRTVLVVPQNHAWSRRSRVSLRHLRRQPLILREAGSGLRHCFEKELARLGKSLSDLDIVVELGSNEAIKEGVMRGLGLAVLSSYAVAKEVKAGQLVAVKVTDLHLDRELFVVWDRRRVLSAPARTFRFFLETNPISDPTP